MDARCNKVVLDDDGKVLGWRVGPGLVLVAVQNCGVTIVEESAMWSGCMDSVSADDEVKTGEYQVVGRSGKKPPGESMGHSEVDAPMTPVEKLETDEQKKAKKKAKAKK